MPIQRSVLVVDSDPADLSNTVLLLQAEGYRVLWAAAFEDAKRLLATESPDLLITGLRLGHYNGLHLVLRSRLDHPEMAAIVTSHYRDPVLEAEAQRQHADFLVTPLEASDFVSAVARSFHASVSSS
jgi:DNA-binding NtrC family response regulator